MHTWIRIAAGVYWCPDCGSVSVQTVNADFSKWYTLGQHEPERGASEPRCQRLRVLA